DAEYTFTLTVDRNLVANFNPEAVQNYTVTLEVSGLGGTVNFTSQSFEPDALVTIVATPDDDYVFAKWMEGSTLISTDYEYTFGVDGDITLTAYFDKITDSGLAGETNVRIYPNPALATITVSGLKPESSVKLFDLAGCTVFEQHTNSSEQNIDVGNLCCGFYLIVIECDAVRLTKKIILK
ncbi:MAG: T9SS type A sorting domain-containing protein, partial [Prolixibacteraceae bacterium]|nr:T9SS type A sorting domain-containing protein [Prolixibacteraceae bacterium]